MKTFISTFAFAVVATFPFFNQITDSLRHDLPHRGKGEASKNTDGQNVYLGIPMLYEQRHGFLQAPVANAYSGIQNWKNFMNRDIEPIEKSSNTNVLEVSGNKLLHHRSHRAKRGIIYNKIKKIKKGIQKAKKKIWKLKEKAVRVIKGPKSTVRPSYESTGGSWGNTGWGAVRSSSKSSYISPGSQGSYGLNDHNTEYGVSLPVGKASAYSGWTYGPTSRGLEEDDNYRYTRSNYDYPQKSYAYSSYEPSIENEYNSYGPPLNDEPSYKGLAVRSRIK